MRVGLFVDVYKPFLSGVTTFVSQHKQALEALGHEVFIFTLGHMDYEDKEPNVYRSPAIPLTETGYQFGFAYSRLARRKVKTMDILHAQHPFISGSLAITYGKRYDIPVIFTNHTRYDKLAPYYVPVLPGGVSQALLEVYLPWFANQCQAVTAPTKAIRRLLRGHGVTVGISLIPNGADLSPFRMPPRLRTRDGMGLPEEAKVSVYVGRLAPEKNLSFLLRAFALVRQELLDAYLVVVGYGPEEQHLHDQAKELDIAHCTVFTGRVPYEQVPDYLALADIFVTASIIEVQPLSIIEALAAGLPAVAIASDAIADTLTDGDNSLLASYNDRDFAARWAILLSDHDLRARLSAKAKGDSQRYDIHRTAAQMAELYQEVVGEDRSQQTQSEVEGAISIRGQQ
jgi:glycosyltransferase involved in cell wall biosynthesis